MRPSPSLRVPGTTAARARRGTGAASGRAADRAAFRVGHALRWQLFIRRVSGNGRAACSIWREGVIHGIDVTR
jgi:hypothetical protein